MPEYVDLRSPLDIVIEARSRAPLDPADEAIAQKLVELVQRTDAEYENDKAAYERTTAEIKRIGNDLCSAPASVSGSTHMKLIAGRAQALGIRLRTLEMFWNGICGWQY
jgi:hypothetical protein